jgi:hypothetical protein
MEELGALEERQRLQPVGGIDGAGDGIVHVLGAGRGQLAQGPTGRRLGHHQGGTVALDPLPPRQRGLGTFHRRILHYDGFVRYQ